MKFNKAYTQFLHPKLPIWAYHKHSGANDAKTVLGSEYGSRSINKQQSRKPEQKILRSRAIYGPIPGREAMRQAGIVQSTSSSAPTPARHYRKRRRGWASTGQALGWRNDAK